MVRVLDARIMSTSPLLQDGRALLDADRLIQAGLADRRASYELWFGRLPPHTGYLVAAGVESLLETLRKPLLNGPGLEAAMRAGRFSPALGARLARLSLTTDIDAVPDGTIVFAQTPVAVVEGPLLEAVLVGTLVLASFQEATAIATRTARLCVAAGADPVIDGASAHASSVAGALAVARAAHVGGASATTNVSAAATLGIPFRAIPRVDLGPLAPPQPSSSETWDDLPAEEVLELEGDDEEAMLLEAKRLGVEAEGWIARGLAEFDLMKLPMRYELVALEQDGSWAPRRGSSSPDVIPGRKMVVRYSTSGRAIADVVHLQTERMLSPKTLGATTLTPLARPVIRGGHTIELPEAAPIGKERALAGRRSLPSAVTHLRFPAPYRVELSPGLERR